MALRIAAAPVLPSQTAFSHCSPEQQQRQRQVLPRLWIRGGGGSSSSSSAVLRGGGIVESTVDGDVSRRSSACGSSWPSGMGIGRAGRRSSIVGGRGVVRAEQSEGGSAAVTTTTTSPPDVDEKGITEVDKDTFWPIVHSVGGEKLVVLDMYTQWCGPCKLMQPKILEMAQALNDVIFLKLDCNQHNKVLAKELGIKSVPTFKIFKNQNLVKEVVGAKIDVLKQAVEDATKA